MHARAVSVRAVPPPEGAIVTRAVQCAEALACAALVSLLCDARVATVACAVMLGVAVVVAPTSAESAATREGEGR